MTAAILLTLSALALHAKPAAAYCSYYYGCRTVTGGAIAGIVIGESLWLASALVNVFHLAS